MVLSLLQPASTPKKLIFRWNVKDISSTGHSIAFWAMHILSDVTAALHEHKWRFSV